MASTAYSGTPLPRKLGLKDGMRVGFAGLPEALATLKSAAAYARLDLAENWQALDAESYDFIQCYTASADEVAGAVPGLRDRLDADGMIWMSWPKKASRVPTDVTEDTIRDTALLHDLVDGKVCAVDAVWSGLKLVIRKELRDRYRKNS